jgi:hypothetical protein
MESQATELLPWIKFDINLEREGYEQKCRHTYVVFDEENVWATNVRNGRIRDKGNKPENRIRSQGLRF